MTTFEILLTLFVGVSALSMLMQLIAIMRLARAASRMQAQVAAFAPRAESLLTSAQQTLEQSRTQIQEVSARATEVLTMTKAQLGQLELVLNDATTRAKVQMDRVELVLDDSISRVHEAVSLVHGGVVKPLREINGVAAGVRAAVAHFLRGTRPTVAQATHDDEMFI